jgi:hypothetical protein
MSNQANRASCRRYSPKSIGRVGQSNSRAHQSSLLHSFVVVLLIPA